MSYRRTTSRTAGDSNPLSTRSPTAKTLSRDGSNWLASSSIRSRVKHPCRSPTTKSRPDVFFLKCRTGGKACSIFTAERISTLCLRGDDEMGPTFNASFQRDSPRLYVAMGLPTDASALRTRPAGALPRRAGRRWVASIRRGRALLPSRRIRCTAKVVSRANSLPVVSVCNEMCK